MKADEILYLTSPPLRDRPLNIKRPLKGQLGLGS